MSVSYRSSSSSGANDAFVTSINIPVPSGAASGDIALLELEQWESANPTVTWPSGFTQVVNLVSGSSKLKAAWKRLSAADTGNYTPTWTGSQWSLGHCVLIPGALASGDPIEATNTATATSTTIPTTSVTIATLAFLAHFVSNENSATATPPTSFTEVQDSNYLHSNYRIPGSTGTFTAPSGTLSASTLALAALVAVKPAASGGSTTIGQPSESDTATTIVRRKNRAIGQPSETDTATTVIRAKRVLLGQAVETSTATAATRRKNRGVAIASETDTAQTVTSAHRRTIGQPAETDTASTLGRSKARALAQPVETDSATSVVRSKTRLLTQTVETDTATSITLSGQHIVPLGQAVETDSTTALSRAKRRSLAAPTESDTATAAVRRKQRTIFAPQEFDTAFGVSRAKAVRPGQAAESSTANPITIEGTNQPVVLGQATETCTATTMLRAKRRAVAFAQTAETGQLLARTKRLVLAQPAESDTAFATTRKYRDITITERVLPARTSARALPSRWHAQEV